MKFIISGGELGGTEIDFPTGNDGEEVVVSDASGSYVYRIQTYTFETGPTKVAIYVGQAV